MNASAQDAQARTSRDYAQDCDAADILGAYRKQFELPRASNGQPLTYLCGHSLGLAPRAVLPGGSPKKILCPTSRPSS